MTLTIGRRGLLGGAAGALAAGALPYDLALAQGTPTTTLRVGMTASAVPLANGVPDQGGEGHRFMGITLFDQLVQWDLTKFDGPAVQRPGLATAWTIDPANPRRWIITLREGVKFHDGKVMDANDVVFSYNRAFKNDVAGIRPPRLGPGAHPHADHRVLARRGAEHLHPRDLAPGQPGALRPDLGRHHPPGRVGGGGQGLGPLHEPRRRHRALEHGELRPSASAA